MEYEHIVHQIKPLYDENSEIMILGSLPSVKSREENFFYGHPKNRFWQLLAAIFEEPLPLSVDEKKKLAIKHHIAIWDTIYSCDIKGSSDSSIRNVIPTDLSGIINGSAIRKIICNGKTSGACFKKYQEKELGRKAVTLPSTSPANAAWTMDRLKEVWKAEILE